MKNYLSLLVSTPTTAHLLPKSAIRIADIIGWPATVSLIEQHAGKRFRLYKQGREVEAIAHTVGEEAVSLLRAHFGIEPFHVPTCDRIKALLRDERVRSEYDRLTRTEKRSGRETVNMLTEMFGTTDRTIYRILKKPGIPELQRLSPA